MVKLNSPIRLLITVSLLSLIYTLNVQASGLSLEERAKVNGIIEFNTTSDVIDAFSSPTKKIIEPLIKPIELKNSIDVTGKNMLSTITKNAITKLMRSSNHLIKISTGSKIIKANVVIDSGSSTFSAWSNWSKRKLQAPQITVTVYYSNGAKPSVSTAKGI
jgi:hypothetical protein